MNKKIANKVILGVVFFLAENYQKDCQTKECRKPYPHHKQRCPKCEKFVQSCCYAIFKPPVSGVFREKKIYGDYFMVQHNPNNHFQAVNAKTHFGTPP